MKMKYLFIGLLAFCAVFLAGCNHITENRAVVDLSDGSQLSVVIPHDRQVVAHTVLPETNEIVVKLDDGTTRIVNKLPEGKQIVDAYAEPDWIPTIKAVPEAVKTIPGFEWIGYALSGVLAIGGAFLKKNLTIQQRMTQALAQGIDAFRNTLDVMPNRELAEKLDSELTRLLKEFQKGANVLSEIQALLKQVETPDMKLLDTGTTVAKAA